MYRVHIYYLFEKCKICFRNHLVSCRLTDISELPTKCIKSTVNLDVLASVQYIDFEGRSDGESIRKIVSLIKPRRLIVVRGTADATEALATYCRAGAVQGKVFSPHLYEVVDATTESHIYQVRLKDSLVSSLQFSRGKDAELAWVDGLVDMQEREDSKVDTIRRRDGNEDYEDDMMEIDSRKLSDGDPIPTLEAVPSGQVRECFILYITLSHLMHVFICLANCMALEIHNCSP